MPKRLDFPVKLQHQEKCSITQYNITISHGIK